MWSCYLTLTLATLTAFTLASPAPLTTESTTVTTLSTLGPDDPRSGVLIHVLRTEDLIADEFPSKPLLLEKLSHLLIRVELGNETVGVNGHHLPILPGYQHPLEVNVKLDQVQMLKMPKDSPLIPFRLSALELSNLADKHMSEGIVAAVFRVTQEPLTVEATRADNVPVQAEAFKVTFAIKILEVDGVSLSQTNIPPIDLLHLVVHPDPLDPTKVGTFTTLAPEELGDLTTPSPVSGSYPTGFPSDFAAPLASTMQAFRNAIQSMAAKTSALFGGHRKPCHKRPHHHTPNHHAQPEKLAKVTHSTPDSVSAENIGRTSTIDTFRRKMKCFTKAIAGSSFAFLLLGLPLAVVIMAITFATNAFIRRRMQSRSAEEFPPIYKAVPMEEKLSDEEAVFLITAMDNVKS